MDEEYDEFEDEESSSEPDETPPATTDLPPEVRKHMDRQSRRIEKLQREVAKSQLQQKYGADVVDLIPEELPASKWEPYAEKLSIRLTPVQGQTEEPAAPVPEQEPSEQERQLAKVAAASAGSGTPQGGPTSKSAEELLEAYRSDPASAMRGAIDKYRSQLPQ